MILTPYLARDEIKQRLRSVIDPSQANLPVSNRTKRTSKERIHKIVDRLDLRAKLADEKTYISLRAAGFRGENPVYMYLFLRLVLPLAGFGVTTFYIFVLGLLADQSIVLRVVACILGAYAGFFAPNLYIVNKVNKRKKSISETWPDALDLLLICVEAGMTIETAFRRVAEEIGVQSSALAEELSLTIMELSILPERRVAYDNLYKRTGVEAIRPIVQALVQTERYGTPLGTALRTLSKESRETRMLEAERKAAALPPKLTVPMLIFFLPVLFAVIIGPAVIQVMQRGIFK